MNVQNAHWYSNKIKQDELFKTIDINSEMMQEQVPFVFSL